ncbi:MAG TPA: hypothetical protein VM695_10070 [Phycisphaerae bacterium]|nr:hypothetical protein [Phycisphaerae bacterium]
MLTVRFPSGVAVTYNAATNFEYHTGNIRLVDSQNCWIAEIQGSAAAIVERVAPCKVAQSINDTAAAIAHLLAVAEREESLPYYGAGAKLAELKRALGRFDARCRAWKGGAS